LQLLILISVVLLTLISSSLARAGEHMTCNATDNYKSAASSLFALQEPLFENTGEYQQWVNRCLLPLSEYERSRQAYFAIDVRDSKSYSRNHIRQSINMPLHAVKSKSFLKNKKILLLDEGVERARLIYACKQLFETGYPNVKVLQGGIIGLQNNAKNELKFNKAEGIYSLTPGKLIFDQRYEPWIVVDITIQPSKRLVQYFDAIFSFDQYPAANQLRHIFNSGQSNPTSGSSPSVILIDKAGQGYEQFELWRNEMSRLLKRDNIFYLQGGTKAFDEYVIRQHAMLRKKEFVMNKPKGCAR